jgi:hypothetical protein
MNWENLQEILEISEKEFEREAEKTEIIDLNARIEKFQDVLKKPDLGITTLIGSEVTLKRKKLTTLHHILIATRDRKEKERFMQNRKLEEKWRDETLPKVLSDLRYVVGTDAEHLMHGTFTLDAVQPKKFPSLEFEIPLVGGGKKKIDLRKAISPPILKMLMEKTFTPVYITVEPTGAYQHGKKLGYYVSGEWEQTRGIEIKMGTLIAIMKV